MKFMCLICADRMMEHMPSADAQRHFDEYAEFTRSLARSGQLVSLNRLLPPETATTVRVRDGKMTAVDGPFAETKEHLGGYFIIEARDTNEAIQIAARIPGARMGCVELRRVADDSPTRAVLAAAGTE
jgi:hypothetical protein